MIHTITVYPKDKAAELLGVSVHTLATWLKEHRYPFTDLSVKGNAVPWKRGHQSWGLSAAQIRGIMDDRARAAPTPKEPTTPTPSVTGYDGVDRLFGKKKAREARLTASARRPTSPPPPRGGSR